MYELNKFMGYMKTILKNYKLSKRSMTLSPGTEQVDPRKLRSGTCSFSFDWQFLVTDQPVTRY
jgi:hypothetical protein